MKYRVNQPFIAFGKAPEAGDVVELTEEQAAVLRDMDSVSPYEIKVQPKPENKTVKKPLRSAPAGRVSRGKTAKRLRKTVKK